MDRSSLITRAVLRRIARRRQIRWRQPPLMQQPPVSMKHLFPANIDKDTVFTVEPDLDFRDQFKDCVQTHKNIRHRGIQMSMEELLGLSNDYERYVTAYKQRMHLRSLIAEANAKNVSYPTTELDEINSQLHSLRPSIARCLTLPNQLLERTPLSEHRLLAECDMSTNQHGPNAHMQVLAEQQHIKVSPSGHIYLMGQAEGRIRAMQTYCSQQLEQAGWSSVSLPYMVRPAIVDACGLDMDNYLLQDDSMPQPQYQNLVLCGNSLPAFGALMCRREIGAKNKSLKWYQIDTSYRAPKAPISLRTSSQYESVSMCAVSSCPLQSEHQLDEITDLIKQIIVALGATQYKIYQVAAPSLCYTESGRVDISSMELPLASVHAYNQFISATLRLVDHQQQYMHINYAHIDLYALLADNLINTNI